MQKRFLPEGLNQVEVCEFMKFNKGMEDFYIELISEITI